MKNQGLKSMLVIVVAALSLSACSTTGGTILGAAVGAGVGHNATGSTAGAIGGAALGGVIGHELSR
ncbi:glycine zipper 2TM domain-containing protein [Aromatoleum toluvorans]|uniref:Glycine zipper 2TM domain-containing protein n=1 Tax=Aromatoleum toluvorans TaxID=92002 RepID=A0ABX1Q204_9RHOO|nr:glycine zipper 2TM domain-containing protein [Aromatoleum toluvorans]NMG45398.1 glycine zipper 2TM domain-containing protein [Aromatoleum toluvorans]